MYKRQGRIHLVREGIPAAVVSVPTRYIHSPVSIIDKNDFENAIKLMAAFLDSIEAVSYTHLDVYKRQRLIDLETY